MLSSDKQVACAVKFINNNFALSARTIRTTRKRESTGLFLLILFRTAAVTGICREPHNQVARLAGNGTGGLYRLKDGTIALTHLAEPRVATWFNKPAGMSYDRLYELLRASHVEPQDLLWQRQMTMGPGLEFSLHSSRMPQLAEEIQSVPVNVQAIFLPSR